MAVGLDHAALNMFAALSCGAVIGVERQIRQRMAGLRTNALVALGASAFVLFSSIYPNEVSQTRVAAQVVSGIGFLGAGIIFRDGFNVHGLNTAATLWCSAAVGLMAGAGAMAYALLLTAMVVFVNLGLRPLVRWIKIRSQLGGLPIRQFRIDMSVTEALVADIRALLLRTTSLGGLHLGDLSATEPDQAGLVHLVAIVGAEALTDAQVEQILMRLAAEPALRRVAWHAIDDM